MSDPVPRPHPRPTSRHWSSARWTLPVGMLLCLALAGCALVPTGGPVQKGRPIQRVDPVADPYVRILPKGPEPGASPESIVSGFLAASASFQNDHGVAREYLAPAVRFQWDPGRRVEVYAADAGFGLTLATSSEDDAVVTVTADHVATISDRGQYTAAPPGDRLTAKYRLRRVAGEWRIVSLPPGLLLTPQNVKRAYRTLNLYFFDPRREVLVPNPIYLPANARERLATELARGLMRGATSWLAPAVRTAFPAGSQLDGDVQVRNEVATVRLGGSATSAGTEALAFMSAQLAWTLSQLPEVGKVRLKVGGDTVHVPGAGELVSADDWGSLDPDATTGAVRGYLARAGKLLVIGQGGVHPVPGPAGSGKAAVHSPAVSLSGERAAWLRDSGRTLLVGELRDGGGSRVVLRGKRLRSPSWDRYGNLWVVEDRGRRSVVWMLAGGTEPVRVETAGLRGRIQALRVARDGTRVALIVRREGDSLLLLGRVERAADGARLAGLVPLPTGLADVADVAWRDADRIAVLGRDRQGSFVPYLVDVDGRTVSATGLGSVGRMVAVAAAPGAPMLAEVAGGEVWQSRDDLGWTRLASGRAPVYPG